jgi:hypothetical protein
LRAPLGSGGAMETGQNSLLSRPDSCPANGDHLNVRHIITVHRIDEKRVKRWLNR